MTPSSRAPLVALVLVALVAFSGCVQMPVEGPVVTGKDTGVHEARSGAAYEPPRPVDGASAQEVVLGFLEAMKATPVSTTVATEFLTEDARTRWRPEDATVTYRGLTAPGGESEVRLWLNSGQHYDARGRWTGPVEGGDARLDFTMVQEAGEWRIDRAPNALLVPESWFLDNYVRLSVHFLEPSGRTLVPEPAHLPRGDSLATNLVRNLLAGQSVATADVLRTAVPTGLSLAVNAVPVDDEGIALLELKGREDSLARGISKGFRAQLAWTLRQVPQVRRFRVTLNGVPVRFEGGADEVSVLGMDPFAPSGPNASREPFGFVEGKLLEGFPGDLEQTTGPFGRGEVPLRRLSVSLDGTWAVGVTADGRSLVRAAVSEDVGPEEEGPTPLPGRFTEVTALAHDAAGRLWVLDRTPAGARLVVRGEGRATEVELPEATGREVRTVLVSPDATRVVSVVADEAGDRILVHRLELDPTTGRFTATEPQRLAPQLPRGRRVVDVGWSAGGDVRVLTELSADLTEARTVAVEGAPYEASAAEAFRVRQGASGLATSLLPGTPEYVFSGQDIRDLGEPASVLPILPSGITWFRYPG